MFRAIFHCGLSCSLVFLLNSCGKPQKKPNPQARPVAVKFEAADTGSISRKFQTVGELKADKEVSIRAERPGQIEEIFVTEGGWVNIDQAVVKIEGDDAEAELALARSNYNSFESLYKEGAISEQELKVYETAYRKAQAAMENLEICSRLSGTVGQIYIDKGDFVNIGDPIMDLVKLYPLRVSYNVPEKTIPLIEVGDMVVIRTDAEPDKEIPAYVDFISPRVDTNSRSVLVRAKVDTSNANAKNLKANLFVKVEQEIRTVDDTILVREEAVYLDQGQEYIYLADGDSDNGYKAKRVPIETGIRDSSGLVEITSGVSNGDLVIFAGLHSIYPGATLNPIQE